MKKLTTILFCLVCNFAGAQTIDGVLSVKKITTEVAKVAQKYASSIACTDGPILAKNIFALKPANITTDDITTTGEGEYLVFWNGDIGCYGGSKTNTQNVAFVEITLMHANFIVDPLKSSPYIKIPVNGFIESIVGTNKNMVVIDVAEFAEDDSGCCPSIKSRNTYQIDNDGKWGLVKKSPIPRKK